MVYRSEREGHSLTDEKDDYYMEGGFLVFTARFLAARGFCCGNGCRHCPYLPKHGGADARLAPPEDP